MNFASVTFLFFYLPAVVALYFALRGRGTRNLILLLASVAVARFKWNWGALVVCVGWSALVSAFTFFDPTGGQRRIVFDRAIFVEETGVGLEGVGGHFWSPLYEFQSVIPICPAPPAFA